MPRPDTLRKLARGLRLPYATVVLAAASDWYGVDLAAPSADGDRGCSTCGALIGPTVTHRDVHDRWHARHDG